MNQNAREFSWSTLRWDGQGPTLPALGDPALTRLLLEHISTRVAIVGRDRRYRYANREALRFMGLASGEVIGHHMSDVLDDGVYRSFVPIFERLFAGESLELRGWVDYQRQGRRYREQVLMPYAADGGAPDCVIVCGLDHTEQRLSEEQLAEKQAQLRVSEALKGAIFDHALAALISTDAAGRVVEFNPSAEAMFGCDRAEAVGRPAVEIVIPERHRAAYPSGRVWDETGQAPITLGRRVELQGRRGDGSEFPMEMVLFRTHAEGIEFYTASITDLSERRNATLQIERQREALRQSEKLTAMGSLLAGVAHELNNPLAIVMGRATLLEEKCETLPELRREAQRIHDAAQRCGRIVRTFLNMARSRPA
jgi:two-component system NtrC family sensor kinase